MTPQILGMRVDLTSYDEAVEAIINWGKAGESRYVCVANVHMVMEAYDSPDFREQVNHAALVTPDGMPLVWMLRWLGNPEQDRVYGPHLTLHILDAAQEIGIPVGFLGGKPETLERLSQSVLQRFPRLHVNYLFSPPFRPMTDEEDNDLFKEISESGLRILFVGLGCPKQEKWMAVHYNRIPAVLVGVGAAFDFLAGTKPQAPEWIQWLGLEWLYRLMREPRRLWQRYFYHNPRFAILALLQLADRHRFR